MSQGNLAIALAAFVAGLIGAFMGAYFKRKGENLATKEDVARITRITEEIRSDVEARAWHSQRWWEEKKRIYAELIRGLNQISDGLWNVLHSGFDPTTRQKTEENVNHSAVAKLFKDIDAYLQHTGIAYVFLEPRSHEIIMTWAGIIQKLHAQLLTEGKEYEYFSELKDATNTAYNNLIEAAREDLAAKSSPA